ncbi:hypothetical protein NLX86_31650 [Streptomyces sp. A3M-1-3]|uniref:hypothetical protein n=1 Tax=Streptomyces sp. A3M-1-3 TaxID=2962044 RepID=UPI0020B7A877|nr:hypothetical protein [Streptomyces sp. A3M-1-3]MCP3822478.1 hypothetical protein [Streptomyces sp. A3M-1-3]
MQTTLRKVMVSAVVFMAVTAGCSSDSSGGEEDQGTPADVVCGGFAKDAPSSTALKAIAGDGNFTSDLSEPDEVLKALREAALIEQSGKTRMQGIAFCWLLPTEDGKSGLRIEFREALGVPERDARLEETVTYFSSGESASSSDGVAKVFFKCRMKAPAHEIIISAELQRSDRIEAPPKDIRAHQITLANAAARKVAADLGCQDTQLANGVPRPTT